MTLRARLRSLSTRTMVVCVVLVVGSVAAGLVAGLAGRSSVERWLMPSTRQGPVMTSPDGEWQARISWEDMGADSYGYPYLWSRIDAWPAGEPEESRTVLYYDDEVLDSRWIKEHMLELEFNYDVVAWRLDVAGEPRIEVTPYYESLAPYVSALFIPLTLLPALVAVVVIVAVKTRKPPEES